MLRFRRVVGNGSQLGLNPRLPLKGKRSIRLLSVLLMAQLEAQRRSTPEIAGSNPAEETGPSPNGYGTWLISKENVGSNPTGPICSCGEMANSVVLNTTALGLTGSSPVKSIL